MGKDRTFEGYCSCANIGVFDTLNSSDLLPQPNQQDTHSKNTDICDHIHEIIISSMGKDFQDNQERLPISSQYFLPFQIHDRELPYFASNTTSSILNICQDIRHSISLRKCRRGLACDIGYSESRCKGEQRSGDEGNEIGELHTG